MHPKFILNGIELINKKCNNKHICTIFQIQNKIAPREHLGTLLLIILIGKLPNKAKYCINKTKEIHFKILHTKNIW